jgi:hypothetical protein
MFCYIFFNVGKVVSGYSVRRDKYGDDRWSLLGKRNPYTAQMFYPIFDKSPIEYGDRLVSAFDSLIL